MLATAEQQGSQVPWSPSEGPLQDRGQLPTAAPCSLCLTSDYPSLHVLTFSLPEHVSWGHRPKELLNTEPPLGKTQIKTSPAMHAHVCIVFLHRPESVFRNWFIFVPPRAWHGAGVWNQRRSSGLCGCPTPMWLNWRLCTTGSRPSHAHPQVGGEHLHSTGVHRRNLNNSMEQQEAPPNLHFSLLPLLETLGQSSGQ